MIYNIPLWLFWAVGAVSVVIGAATLLAVDRLIRCLRWWMIRQLRWLRSPRYRRMLRLQGWLLLVLGTLMIVLLSSYCFPR